METDGENGTGEIASSSGQGAITTREDKWSTFWGLIIRRNGNKGRPQWAREKGWYGYAIAPLIDIV